MDSVEYLIDSDLFLNFLQYLFYLKVKLSRKVRQIMPFYFLRQNYWKILSFYLFISKHVFFVPLPSFINYSVIVTLYLFHFSYLKNNCFYFYIIDKNSQTFLTFKDLIAYKCLTNKAIFYSYCLINLWKPKFNFYHLIQQIF